jgi:hypothetical protein
LPFLLAPFINFVISSFADFLLPDFLYIKTHTFIQCMGKQIVVLVVCLEHKSDADVATKIM